MCAEQVAADSLHVVLCQAKLMIHRLHRAGFVQCGLSKRHLLKFAPDTPNLLLKAVSAVAGRH